MSENNTLHGFNSDKNEDVSLVKQALRAILSDPLAPAAARAQAARTLAEITGILGRHQEAPTDNDKPLSALSAAELKAELRRLQGIDRS